METGGEGPSLCQLYCANVYSHNFHHNQRYSLIYLILYCALDTYSLWLCVCECVVVYA